MSEPSQDDPAEPPHDSSKRAGEAPPSRTRSAGRELARLVAAQVFLHGGMTGLRLAIPLAALREGRSAFVVGGFVALFALSQVFLALPAGRYADRHGLRRPLAAAVGCGIAAGAAGFAGAFTPGWPHLVWWAIAAVLSGAGAGTAIIALQRHVGRAARDATERKRVFSWLALGPALSNFLGPVVAGLAIDAGGFGWAFALLAAMPLATWLLARRASDEPSPLPAGSAVAGAAWELLREPRLRLLLAVNWLLSSCWDVHAFAVPLVGHERGYSASAIGAVLGAFALAAAAVRIVLPALAARLVEWRMLVGAMLAAGVIFALYPLMPNVASLMALSAALGVVLGSVQPMIMSLLHHVTPAHRHGEAIGLRMTAMAASSVAMPLMFGAFGAVVGAAGLFWCVGAAVAAGSRWAWRLRGEALAD